jgi:hypothetical protein
MPAKVSLNMREMVTAGLANEVDEVNQYAAPIQAATAPADSAARPVRARATITAISPEALIALPPRITRRCARARLARARAPAGHAAASAERAESASAVSAVAQPSSSRRSRAPRSARTRV